MAFAHPEILWGLWGLAIPVIIHLLNFRRYRKVAFSQVAFLQALQRETRSRQAIRHWLVLLMRLLAVAGLVLAFAQPFIPADDATDAASGGAAVALYVDNSPSMDAVGEEGALLQVAVEKAIRVVEGHGETDRFFVQTNSFTPRDTRLLTRDEALQRLAEINPSPVARHITDVMQRTEGALLSIEGRRRSAYLFTDLQESTHDLSAVDRRFTPDTSIAYHFVPQSAAEAVNAWVDSVWFDTPTRLAGRPAALRMRIRHNAQAGASGLPLELRINGARAAIGSFNLLPGLPTDTVLRFTHGEAGLKSATVSIEDAPVEFDDDFHFGFRVTDVIGVAHFTEKPEGELALAIRRVFGTTGDQHRVETSNIFSLDALEAADFVVVSDWPSPSSGMAEALRGFVERGGSCLWMPDSLEAVTTNGAVRKALGFGTDGDWVAGENRVDRIATDNPLFAGIFRKMPRALDLPRLALTLRRSPKPREEVLATTETGAPFLSRIGIGAGSAYLLGATSHGEHSNFTRHALFVPLMLRLAERARYTPMISGILGSTEPIALPGDVGAPSTLSLRSGGDSPSIWQPSIRKATGASLLTLDDKMLEAGLYGLYQTDSLLTWIGVNADRTESDPKAYDVPTWEALCDEAQWPAIATIEADTEAMSAVTRQLQQGTPLWKAALLAALLALLIESILLRAWKRTSS